MTHFHPNRSGMKKKLQVPTRCFFFAGNAACNTPSSIPSTVLEKGTNVMTKLSGLQKEVLSIYRILLREALKKDTLSGIGAIVPSTTKTASKPSFIDAIDKDGTCLSYAKKEFRKQAMEVKRSDFKTIEYKIRKAKKQIKLLQMPGVTTVGGT